MDDGYMYGIMRCSSERLTAMGGKTMAPASTGPGRLTTAANGYGNQHDRAAWEGDGGNIARAHRPWWVVLKTICVVTRVFFQANV